MSEIDDRLGPPRSVMRKLYTEAYCFDFFQAVRLLTRLDTTKRPIGHAVLLRDESVRVRAHLSLNFPASQIYELLPPSSYLPTPILRVTFMGLIGPSGVLPQHYTELLIRLQREQRGEERSALRSWLDIFHHRLISLFYRAWEKYRLPVAYESGEAVVPTVRAIMQKPPPDPITQILLCLIGMGMTPLRHRLSVSVPGQVDPPRPRRILARIEDLALLHYSGLLAQRPRSAIGLEGLLRDYFGLMVKVQQFAGQWLRLDPSNQSRLGAEGGNNDLGMNVVAGDRVWEVQSKIRLRVGPLTWQQFTELLPDQATVPQRKTFFLLVQLMRLYVGPELDFDIQLVLRAREIPACVLNQNYVPGVRLGWNSWILSRRASRDAEDAVFQGVEVYTINP